MQMLAPLPSSCVPVDLLFNFSVSQFTYLQNRLYKDEIR